MQTFKVTGLIRTILFPIFYFIATVSAAQVIDVHGSVIDGESLEDLIGVHVFTNLENGTTTDIDGNFHLRVRHQDTLHFSMLGYESRLLTIYDSTKTQGMIIQLKQGTIVLKSVGITDYFQANTIIKTPERKVFRVPGIKYPDAPSRNQYLYLGSAFIPRFAALTMARKDYKQHKKLYDEYPQKVKDDRALVEAKEKMQEALEAMGEKLDDYYMLDFMQFIGLTPEGVANRSAYDLVKILKGQVDRYLESLHKQEEGK